MPVPEFILSLRAKIGHEPLWMPGVSVVVLDDVGRVLLGKRADNGLWALISGIPEPGEQPAVAAVRECAEETGVEVEVVALTSLVAGDRVEYPNGDQAYYLDACFWARPVAGDAHVADDESTAVGWFDPADLPTPMHQASVGRLEQTLAFRAAQQAGGHPVPFLVR